MSGGGLALALVLGCLHGIGLAGALVLVAGTLLRLSLSLHKYIWATTVEKLPRKQYSNE